MGIGWIRYGYIAVFDHLVEQLALRIRLSSRFFFLRLD